MRSTLGKVCMRKFGNITRPFAIGENMQIEKIKKSTLAVKILRMAINWLIFLCQIKTQQHMLSPPNTYLCWYSAAFVESLSGRKIFTKSYVDMLMFLYNEYLYLHLEVKRLWGKGKEKNRHYKWVHQIEDAGLKVGSWMLSISPFAHLQLLSLLFL